MTGIYFTKQVELADGTISNDINTDHIRWENGEIEDIPELNTNAEFEFYGFKFNQEINNWVIEKEA